MTGIDRIEEATRLLQAGQTLAEVQRQLLPAPWQRAMRACAAAGVFTDELFDSVLQEHAQPEAPQLADLASRNLIEPAGTNPPSWRVPREEAAGWMRDWNTAGSGPGPASSLVDLERQLAHWHGEHGDRNEQLRHLLIADTQQAASLFRTMFDDADGRRDFACCQDLLDVLADPNRITFAGPAIADLRLDRAGYLRARLHWSVDYSRSAQFLMPPGLRERTERLLSDSGPRVWQLYAPGGTGKTIQLQWLVARHCATAAVDTPCARIDFDVIDPVNVAHHPWLLLLEVADQLERRWPRRVFERLDRYASYRSLARRTTSELTRDAASGLAGLHTEEVEQQVSEIFVRRFNGAAKDRPIVLVVDTLEEVMLGSGGELDQLLRLLARLLRDCPALRLVLSGRYDLRERAPEAMADLGPIESVELTDFTTDQVKTYLRDIRGVAETALQDAVVARAGGQPFLVALYADVIEEHPGISPGELMHQAEPATQLLIDRVIRRIGNPDVRWLVRYGVVPRRLRYDDVATVMWPFIARGRAGPSGSDDPRKDPHQLSSDEDVFPFGTAPHGDTERAAVWHGLLSYAARPSWVSPGDDGQSVVFHPNVRAPMRNLIADQPVFRELHEAFRRRFEHLADANPAAAPAYLREAMYHRIQLADSGVADFWRSHIARCLNAGDLDGMDILAGELLREDYTKNRLPRLGADDEPVLPIELLVEAHVFQAYVAAERARAVMAEASDPLWSAVQRSLDNAAFVREHSPGHPAASALEVALQAALLIIGAKPAQAIDLIRPILPSASGASRVDLLRAMADAQLATNDPQAGPSYRIAFNLAGTQGRADQQGVIALSLASMYEDRGHLDEGLEWAARLPAPVADTPASTARGLVRGQLLIECYAPAAALQSLADADIPDLSAAVEIARLRAQACLMLGREGDALGALQEAVAVAEQMPPAAGYGHLAQIHQLRGVVLGELLAVDEAEDSFQLAAGLWGEIGFSDGNPEWSYLYRKFLIRHVGDLAAAAQVPRPAMADGELALLWDEQTAELRAAQAVTPRRDRATEPDLAGLPPRQLVRIISARLARSWSLYRDQVPALASALRRIRPASARLLALDELRRCEQADSAGVAFIRTAFATVNPTVADEAEDAALHRRLLAELHRLRGAYAIAGNAVEEAEVAVRAVPGMQLRQWRYLQACGRLQVRAIPELVTELLNGEPERRLLRAASRLILATAAPARRSAAERRELLRQALADAEVISRPTAWAADIFRVAGELGDPSMLALAADMDQQLGRPDMSRSDGPGRPARAGEVATGDQLPWLPLQILADRPGERAIALPGPGWELADLDGLQRRVVVEWPRLADGMGGELFRDSPLRGLAHSELTALRLESDDVIIHALPWELGVPPRHAVAVDDRWRSVAYRSLPAAAARIDARWLQRALCSAGLDLPIDGVLGPMTLDRLGRVSPDARLPLTLPMRTMLGWRMSRPARSGKPLVIVVRPGAVVESKISSHWDSGFDVADLYTAAGFRVHDVTSLADVVPTTGRDQVRILHVTARMDMRGAGPFFDFSPMELQERLGSKARGTDIHPKHLVRWLRRCAPGQEPLVVLDPPYPGSPFDVPWQLVLRNWFAATLFSEAAAQAVIATGVQTSGPYITPIARGIAEGLPLVSIADRLRSSHGGNVRLSQRSAPLDWAFANDALAAQATAIFAAPSAFTLLPGE